MKTSKNTHMFAYNIQNMAAKTNISQPLTIVKAEKDPQTTYLGLKYVG